MSRMRDALGELAETLRRGMPSTVTVARAGALAAPEPPAVFFGERTLEPVVQGYGATVRVEVRVVTERTEDGLDLLDDLVHGPSGVCQVLDDAGALDGSAGVVWERVDEYGTVEIGGQTLIGARVWVRLEL
jgi:hypothetical protein